MNENQLKPHQVEGIEFLVNKKYALLADKMGLGKSRQTVEAAKKIQAKNILIICPAIARALVWEKEITKWWPERLKDFYKIETRKDECSEGITVVSYDLAHFKTEYFRQFEWDLVVLDEAHFLKSPKPKRTQVILGKNGICAKSKRVWALTGTPMPGYPNDLWVLMYAFGATKLPYFDFVKRYCTYVENTWGFQITGIKVENAAELKQALGTIMLRRTQDTDEMPKPHIYTVEVPANPVDIEIHENFVSYVFPIDQRKLLSEKLDAQEKVLNSIMDLEDSATDNPNQDDKKLVALQAMSASLSTYRRYTGMMKVDAIASMVTQELFDNEYQKVVIFLHHRDVASALTRALAPFGVRSTETAPTPKQREAQSWAFRQKHDVRGLIANIKAMGTAIDLTCAHQVIFAEQSYVPDDNEQALARVARPPQRRKVVCRVITVKDSNDARVGEIIAKKLRAQRYIF